MTPQQLFRAAAREAEIRCPSATRILNRIGVGQELAIQRRWSSSSSCCCATSGKASTRAAKAQPSASRSSGKPHAGCDAAIARIRPAAGRYS
jgi:hypothetical protein